MPRIRFVAVLLLVLSAPARGEEPPPASPNPPTTAPPSAPPPQPYSLPFQLRSAAAATLVRSDSVFATYAPPGTDRGLTFVTTLFFSYKVWGNKLLQVAPFIRFALSANDAPGTTPSGTSFVNPMVGGTLSIKLPADLRFAFYLAFTIPVGMGGGDTPDPAEAAATNAGILARSALDNSLFSVNDLVVIPGFDLAWTRFGLTIQVEATFFQLNRVRGSAVQKDEFRTNFTTGIHVAYFVIPQLSVGAELRYQRWLSTPVSVELDPTGATRDTLSIAGGVRGHFKFGGRFWLRPAVVYAHGLDDPMNARGYHIVQLDIPFYF